MTFIHCTEWISSWYCRRWSLTCVLCKKHLDTVAVDLKPVLWVGNILFIITVGVYLYTVYCVSSNLRLKALTSNIYLVWVAEITVKFRVKCSKHFDGSSLVHHQCFWATKIVSAEVQHKQPFDHTVELVTIKELHFYTCKHAVNTDMGTRLLRRLQLRNFKRVWDVCWVYTEHVSRAWLYV